MAGMQQDKEINAVKPKRERSTNFTNNEIRLLVNLLEGKYGQLIENKQTDAVTWEEKKNAWVKLQDEFNSKSGLVFRSAKMLQVKYEGLKKALKKKKAYNSMEFYKTGSGTPQDKPYTDVEEKLLKVLAAGIDGLPTRNDSDEIDKTIITTNAENTPNEQQCEDAACENQIVEDEDDSTENKENDTPISSHSKWTTWKPKDLKRPINSKLLSPKKKRICQKADISNKYSDLADKRQSLVDLQIELAKKEIELKQKQIDNEVEQNQRNKNEHEKRLELLELQIKSFSN